MTTTQIILAGIGLLLAGFIGGIIFDRFMGRRFILKREFGTGTNRQISSAHLPPPANPTLHAEERAAGMRGQSRL